MAKVYEQLDDLACPSYTQGQAKLLVGPGAEASLVPLNPPLQYSCAGILRGLGFAV